MSETSAILVWNGDIEAKLTCVCGTETSKDVWVGDIIECEACHRFWRLCRTVACEPATEREIADHRVRYFGEGP